jgi:polar amino acid transport system substrate-binding protein
LIAISLAWLLLAGVAAAQNPPPPNPDLPAQISDTAHLRGGWYPWDPYQYRDYRRGVPILTGFDVEVERALARIMRVELVLPEIAWENISQHSPPGRRILRRARRRARRAASTHISQNRIERRRMF